MSTISIFIHDILYMIQILVQIFISAWCCIAFVIAYDEITSQR